MCDPRDPRPAIPSPSAPGPSPGDGEGVPAAGGEGPFGIIAGSGFLEELDPRSLGATVELDAVETPLGTVHVQRSSAFVFLRRHGEGVHHPPHRIPHHAHILALEALGVRAVAGLTSTGSLRSELPPGTIMIPEDYLSRSPPPTFEQDEPVHIVPALDPDLRETLERVAGRAVAALPGDHGVAVHAGGVYAETSGPRFETRAEVRSLARDADIVGMTAASEATLAQERGMRYAILSIVDNWANGVTSEPLSLESFRARQTANRGVAASVLRELVRFVSAP